MAAPTDPPAPEAPAPVADAPWTADAREYFGDDENAIAAFDRYMREKQQPYVTQLEQSPAQKLYADLTDPEKVDVTVGALVQSVYGEDAARRFISMWGEDGQLLPEGANVAEAVEAAAEPETPTEPETAADEPATLTPEQEWARTKMEQEAAEQEEREYDEFLDKVIAEDEFKLAPSDKRLLHPFMQASETVGEAVAKFHAHGKELADAAGVNYDDARARILAGEQPAPEPTATTEAPTAPPTLGSSGAPAAAPPVAKQYNSWDDLDDALVDYQREQVAKKAGHAPPTV